MQFLWEEFIASFLVLVLSAIFLGSVHAGEPQAHCYNLIVATPAREAHEVTRTELWCYRETSAGLYIYNGDANQVRAELAILKLKTGELAHGSLAAGKLILRKLDSHGFNPFAIPLVEPNDKLAQAEPSSSEFKKSAASVLAQLERAAMVKTDQMTIKSGKSAADADYMPWRGFWWPYQGMAIINPMTKYDAYLRSRGAAYGAVNWENSNHYYSGTSWEGHCNGWAASAILRTEPAYPHYDSISGQRFSVSDLKGLWAEADYCADAAFYGFRDEASSGVNPADFHYALTYYIGQLAKPIAYNFDTNGMVDNRVISGYTMDMYPSANGYEVVANVRVHDYDGFITNTPGIAPYGMYTYRYTLYMDESGNAYDGYWQSPSPGFVWVPLGAGRCENGNSYIDVNYLESILGK